MKRIDLKNKIKNAFISSTPKLKENTKELCSKTIQEDSSYLFNGNKNKFNNKKLLIAVFATSFVALLTVGGTIGAITSFNVSRNSTDMSIYLDVNPSIQIDVNARQRVINCTPLNEDATIVLANLNLRGVELETALSSIVGSLYIKGYLSSESNSILVSVENANDEKTLTELTNQITDIFNQTEDMECSIIAQQVEKNDELFKEAQENEISIGKMSLINKIIDTNFLYSSEDIVELASMSIKELNLIYQTSIQEEEKPPHHDVITGNPNGYIDQNEAFELVLEKLQVSEEDVRWHNIEVVGHYDSPNQRKMLYLITLALIDDPTRLQFYIDCVTGEFVEKPQDNQPDSPIGKPRSI